MPQSITQFKLGLGWDTRCDLDSSVICLDPKGEVVDIIYYGQTANRNRSIMHSGDNLTGEGRGDDEVITVRLDQLPPNVDSIWPVISIYTTG